MTPLRSIVIRSGVGSLLLDDGEPAETKEPWAAGVIGGARGECVGRIFAAVRPAAVAGGGGVATTAVTPPCAVDGTTGDKARARKGESGAEPAMTERRRRLDGVTFGEFALIRKRLFAPVLAALLLLPPRDTRGPGSLKPDDG